MPFNVHPLLLIDLIGILVLVVAAFFVAGWAFRKGWDAAAPGKARRQPEPPRGSERPEHTPGA